MIHYYPMHEVGYLGPGEGLFGLLIVVLAIVGAVLWYKYSSSNKKDTVNVPEREADAVAILRERYAKGEINTEEYTERKKVLDEK